MAREKTLRVVYTFSTTTAAVKMEQYAAKKGAPGRLIPVPRQISAGCGMAWSAPAETRTQLDSLIRESAMEVEETYELLL